MRRNPGRQCLYCYKKLTLWADAPLGDRNRYGYNGHGYFCTLRCGYNYAVQALRNEEDR